VLLDRNIDAKESVVEVAGIAKGTRCKDVTGLHKDIAVCQLLSLKYPE
jgi:hypothetical protein